MAFYIRNIRQAHQGFTKAMGQRRFLSKTTACRLVCTKPLFIQWNSSLELGKSIVHSTAQFHHLAEHTLHTNAAFCMNIGPWIFEPTETSPATLERMGIKEIRYRFRPKEKYPEFVKNVSNNPETEEAR